MTRDNQSFLFEHLYIYKYISVVEEFENIFI
jgi:hypothetical protein